MQAQAPLLQAPIPNFPWMKHESTHPVVQSSELHVDGVVEQLPPTHALPPPQSVSVQHAKEQTQLPPCLV